ncbi:MAG: TIGR03862 family flavoprotein [Flavobacteriia bacterium]|nr:TIGR03862 family flavoprotein [Flavobacteriia bacterium]
MAKIPKILIIGGGPAGLIVASQLLDFKANITIIDHKPAVGRKFLVAGEGGFNLTHSEPLESFIQKYDSEVIKEWVTKFTPADFRSWLSSIGIETYIGSSGKVFPIEGTKPIQVLNAWLKHLKKAPINWQLKSELIDFNDKFVRIKSKNDVQELPYDFLVFALGGASWKKTGSDGAWFNLFAEKKISMIPFQSGNTGLELKESTWRKEFEGQIIKNCRLQINELIVAGDLVITHYGIEGKPAYAVNRPLRANDFKGLTIDFKPQLTVDKIETTLRNADSVRKAFKQLKLSDAIYSWLKEELPKEQFTDPGLLAKHVKTFGLEVIGLRPLDEAISTVGGVSMDAIDSSGELKQHENVFCCGEMLDWDAPTGGYLLQACVSSGYAVGQTIAGKL